MSPFLGPLIPVLWTSGDVYPGFQSQGGSLACFLACVILRFTSGATPVDFFVASMAAQIFEPRALKDGVMNINEIGDHNLSLVGPWG